MNLLTSEMVVGRSNPWLRALPGLPNYAIGLFAPERMQESRGISLEGAISRRDIRDKRTKQMFKPRLLQPCKGSLSDIG